MFPTLETCYPSSETDANKKLFFNHLGALQQQFSLHFKDDNVTKFEWVRSSLATKIFGLMTCKQEHLIDISHDDSLKYIFNTDELPQFWMLVKK
jgi:hypothetical protein